MNYLKIVVMCITALFVSSARGQQALVRDSVYEFLPENAVFSLPDDVERELNRRLTRFESPRERIRFSLDLRSVGVNATLHARREVWRHRLSDSSVLNLKKQNLGYTYSPRDFRTGPIGSSVMPFVRFVFGQ